MNITNFDVSLKDNKIFLHFKNGVTAQIFEINHLRFKLAEKEIFMLLKQNQIKAISNEKTNLNKTEFDKVVIINSATLNLDENYALRYLVCLAKEAGLNLIHPIEETLPSHLFKQYTTEFHDLLKGLGAFGIKLEKKKTVSTKAQHRWNKAIANIEFKIDRPDSKAKIIWRKANEMVILAGAQMASETPLLKDGTVGFGARFALTLREEHKNSWNPETYTTLEDIILKSVNEVGHFLYFAGTNSWLEMFDEQGRSLHELTVK